MSIKRKIDKNVNYNDELFSPIKWYIITVVSGQEDSVVNNLQSRIKAYGFSEKVEDIKIIKEKNVKTEIFNEENCPSMRKSQNVVWETIQDPKTHKISYKKIKTEEKNKFSGYIFLKADLVNKDLWYMVRNTSQVTGIVGSSGKNAQPVPLTSGDMEKLLSLNNDGVSKEEILESASELSNGEEISNVYQDEHNVVIEKVEYEAPFEVGANVKIIAGNMEGESGLVTALNKFKGVANVEIDLFGRINTVEIPYNELEEITK